MKQIFTKDRAYWGYSSNYLKFKAWIGIKMVKYLMRISTFVIKHFAKNQFDNRGLLNLEAFDRELDSGNIYFVDWKDIDEKNIDDITRKTIKESNKFIGKQEVIRLFGIFFCRYMIDEFKINSGKAKKEFEKFINNSTNI